MGESAPMLVQHVDMCQQVRPNVDYIIDEMSRHRGRPDEAIGIIVARMAMSLVFHHGMMAHTRRWCRKRPRYTRREKISGVYLKLSNHVDGQVFDDQPWAAVDFADHYPRVAQRPCHDLAIREPHIPDDPPAHPAT
jgi:hypothetical protein